MSKEVLVRHGISEVNWSNVLESLLDQEILGDIIPASMYDRNSDPEAIFEGEYLIFTNLRVYFLRGSTFIVDEPYYKIKSFFVRKSLFLSGRVFIHFSSGKVQKFCTPASKYTLLSRRFKELNSWLSQEFPMGQETHVELQNKNYYDLLNLPFSYTKQDLEASYGQLVSLYTSPSKEGGPSYQEKLKLIQEAYTTLSDSNKKDTYDKSLLNHIISSKKKTVVDFKATPNPSLVTQTILILLFVPAVVVALPIVFVISPTKSISAIRLLF